MYVASKLATMAIILDERSLSKRPTWNHFAALFHLKVFGTYDLDFKETFRLAQRQLNLAEATGAERLPANYLARPEIVHEVPQVTSLPSHTQIGRPTAVFKIAHLARDCPCVTDINDDSTENTENEDKRMSGEECEKSGSQCPSSGTTNKRKSKIVVSQIVLASVLLICSNHFRYPFVIRNERGKIREIKTRITLQAKKTEF